MQRLLTGVWKTSDRLMQSALAGFLSQQGCQDKSVVRHYLDALFRKPEVASR